MLCNCIRLCYLRFRSTSNSGHVALKIILCRSALTNIEKYPCETSKCKRIAIAGLLLVLPGSILSDIRCNGSYPSGLILSAILLTICVKFCLFVLHDIRFFVASHLKFILANMYFSIQKKWFWLESSELCYKQNLNCFEIKHYNVLTFSNLSSCNESI